MFRQESSGDKDLCWNAYEKLDGTNVGFACNGKIYGRRYTIPDTETSYQGASLRDPRLPRVDQIEQVKNQLLKILCVSDEQFGNSSPEQKVEDWIQLSVYGELLVPPLEAKHKQFGYEEPW